MSVTLEAPMVKSSDKRAVVIKTEQSSRVLKDLGIDSLNKMEKLARRGSLFSEIGGLDESIRYSYWISGVRALMNVNGLNDRSEAVAILGKKLHQYKGISFTEAVNRAVIFSSFKGQTSQ